ncbi:Sporulation related domain-containing protein [Rhodoblastus acidophilus]|uniref:Sporulation related domain-containing protein n=1 Tax=Rhodoblastus acidophilus TaxID=1074 RepID=A0A212Q631_RHOAC|nr:SPOR domain-containing protein [Rhodoblastus acidophilus]PPQ36343.1 hypothetical protein CKO16_18105 [Rhodoblastus acidophilus]RAI19730.1 hypothetical protein CH337_11405 [Rhodoblastus acidophilus]SNB54755.1 Sporulation related domain-containing protein [Rhodoblastus acidophilus]
MGESAAKYRPELDLDEFERRLRAAAPTSKARQASANAPDPLAELARLVGGAGDGRPDPFEALFRAQKAVAEGSPAPLQAPQSHEPYFENAAPAPSRGYAPEPDPHWVEEPPHVDAPWAAQAPEFAPESQAFAPQAPRPAGRRKVVYAMAAVLVGGVALFAGGLALKKGSTSGEVVTIQADKDPAKVKPTAQEAAANGSGQALFDRKDDASAPAKVVSKTEQPADLAIAARQAQGQTAAAAGIATPTPPAPGSAAPAAAGAQPSGEAPLMAPKKVKTVSIRADGSLLNAPAEKPRSGLPTMASSGVSGVTPTPVARPAAPRAPSTTEAALQAQKPKAKPEAKVEPVAATPAASGDWAVQLAGAPTEAEARAAANRYVAKFSSALQGHHPSFVSGQVGDKTIYRVRVGRLSKDSATSMCNAIKGQGGACFIVKN